MWSMWSRNTPKRGRRRSAPAGVCVLDIIFVVALFMCGSAAASARVGGDAPALATDNGKQPEQSDSCEAMPPLALGPRKNLAQAGEACMLQIASRGLQMCVCTRRRRLTRRQVFSISVWCVGMGRKLGRATQPLQPRQAAHRLQIRKSI
ncbi:hypothetical protein GQ54DRAFT_225076 [Martensiomyces pterosporus]|nr:hypothetical protein GQ54DRAFT_225076 [Martensiomyces pterosporus]